MVARGVRSRALRAHPSYRLYSALVRYDDHRQRKIGSIAPRHDPIDPTSFNSRLSRLPPPEDPFC
jgi:hypothetical protein